ncbi:hypothetical protein [Enemella sp. A6]|uniref:hypothetical protein n=1 Tax=Enemella sp. A6 TaxID=3440152 RepID=UPI003EB7E089
MPPTGPDLPPWSPWTMLRFLFRRVIVDQVSDGRLRDTGWSPGLRAIVIAGLALYVLSLALAVFAQPIRARTDLVLQLNFTVPVMVMPVMVTILLFALAALFTAGLHMVWWLRLAITVMTVAVLVQPVTLGDGWQATDIIAVTGAVLLCVLMLVRWRARFAWWEFVVALLVIGAAVIGPILIVAANSIPSARPLAMFSGALQVFALLWLLAVPVAFLAGASMAELTASTVTWTVTTVWQGLNSWRRRLLPIGFALLVGLLIYLFGRTGWGMVNGDLSYAPMVLLAGVAYSVPPLLLCWLVTWRADRVPTGDKAVRPDPDDIPAVWTDIAPAMAGLLALILIGDTLLGTILNAFGVDWLTQRSQASANSVVISMIRSYTTAVISLIAALWLSGRGRRIMPMGLAAFAGLMVTDVTYSVLGVSWSYEGVIGGLALAGLLVFGWLLLRGELTADRGLALFSVLLLLAVFEHREIVFEPFTALIGLLGVGSALLVGLIWRLLTDNEFARGDSAWFPQSARVLVALANATFGAAVLALDALMGGHWIGDLTPFEGAGDRYLGISLFLTVAYAGLTLALRGRVVKSHEHEAPPPDDPASAEGNVFPTVRGDELWHTGWQR